MKKIFLFSLVAFMAVISISCSSGVKPADPAITYGAKNQHGWKDVDIRDCFKVEKVGVAMTRVNIYDHATVTLTIKVLKTPNWPKDKILDGEATIEVLSKDNGVLVSDEVGGWHSSAPIKGLFNSKEGDVITVTTTCSHDFNTTESEQFMKDAKYVRLSNLGFYYNDQQN